MPNFKHKCAIGYYRTYPTS